MPLSFNNTHETTVFLLEPLCVTIRATCNPRREDRNVVGSPFGIASIASGNPYERKCVELWTNMPTLSSEEVAAAARSTHSESLRVEWHREPAVAPTIPPQSMYTTGSNGSGVSNSYNSTYEYKATIIPVAIGKCTVSSVSSYRSFFPLFSLES
jgi:hypothetical protein